MRLAIDDKQPQETPERWTAEQRAELREWGKAFAKERGIWPRDVMKAIREGRRRGRVGR